MTEAESFLVLHSAPSAPVRFGTVCVIEVRARRFLMLAILIGTASWFLLALGKDDYKHLSVCIERTMISDEYRCLEQVFSDKNAFYLVPEAFRDISAAGPEIYKFFMCVTIVFQHHTPNLLSKLEHQYVFVKARGARGAVLTIGSRDFQDSD